jgi:hypothetical protein
VELIAREWSLESLRYALGLSPADRDAFFNGVKDTATGGSWLWVGLRRPSGSKPTSPDRRRSAHRGNNCNRPLSARPAADQHSDLAALP